MNFKDYLNEAKTGRAWGGKLDKVEKLFSWMYDKDIMNKGEKAQKDRLFQKYRRFYNDGEIPRGKLYSHIAGQAKYSKPAREEVAEILETEVESFMKKVLSKYLPKIDRGDFRLDTEIDYLEKMIRVISKDLDLYWVGDMKKKIKDEEILSELSKIENLILEINKGTKEFNEKNTEKYDEMGLKSWERPNGLRLGYQMELFAEYNLKVPAKLEKQVTALGQYQAELVKRYEAILQTLKMAKEAKVIKK